MQNTTVTTVTTNTTDDPFWPPRLPPLAGRSISPDSHNITHPKLLNVALWGNKFDSAACVVWQPIMTVIDLDISVQEVDGAFNCVQK